MRDVVKSFDSSLGRVLNLTYPEPITTIELAEIVRDTIAELTNGKTVPKIELVDQGLQPLFTEDSKI